LGIRSQEDLELHFAKGNIFENLVISEMYKNSINNATKSKTYFWRDKSQNEVDLIVETGVRLDAIEIKSAKTIYQNQFRGLDYFKNLKADTNLHLVYGGNENQERTNYSVHSILNLPQF
jgi:hypothetical protein